MPGTEDNQWHLDKKVPLAMMFTIAGQTAFLVVAITGLFYRVDALEQQVRAYTPQAERVIRLEEKIESLRGDITEVKILIRSGQR